MITTTTELPAFMWKVILKQLSSVWCSLELIAEKAWKFNSSNVDCWYQFFCFIISFIIIIIDAICHWFDTVPSTVSINISLSFYNCNYLFSQYLLKRYTQNVVQVTKCISALMPPTNLALLTLLLYQCNAVLLTSVSLELFLLAVRTDCPIRQCCPIRQYSAYSGNMNLIK